MYIPRFIPRLDIKNENLIKGIQLEGLRVIGDPNKFAVKYYKEGADELLFMDTVASLYGRNNLTDVIKKTAKNVFIPITVGGGIRTLKDAEKILRNGADKFAINTAAIKNPKLITNLAKQFGSQCVVLSVEAKKINTNKWEVFTHNGREKTGIDVIEWVKKSTNLGAGEVLLTSVDCDGTKKGFDVALIESVSKICKIPLIVSGGLGSLADINHIKKLNINGICAGSSLHYNLLQISQIKKNLNKC